MRRSFELLVALALASCLGPAAPYRCDRVGGDPACDSEPGARCIEGYCASPAPRSICASGLRFTSSAADPGACVVTRTDAATHDTSDDVPIDVRVPDDRVSPIDVRVPDDLVSPADVADAAATIDAPTPRDVVDVIDATTPRDVVDVIDVTTPRDVVDVIDVTTPRDVVDVIDVTTPRDVVDVIDVTTPRDVVDVIDAPAADVSVCPSLGRIISPIANERHFGRSVMVRYEGADSAPTVVVAAGLRCDGATSTTQGQRGTAQVNGLSRGYYCIALETSESGRACRTPWRHLAVMGNVLEPGRFEHWGTWPDFDNDGFADLLLGTASSALVLRYTSAGTFSPATSPAPPPGARSIAAVAAPGDLNGDGYGDAVVAWVTSSGRALYAYLGSPTGLRPTAVFVGAPYNVNDELWGTRLYNLGDRDGNGHTEVGVLDNLGRGVTAFTLHASNAPLRLATLAVPGAILSVASGADLDGDSRPDVAISYDNRVAVFSGGGSGSIVILPAASESPAGFGRVIASGSDTDGDGVSELAVYVPAQQGVVHYSLVGGTVSPERRDPIATTEIATLVMPGDMENVLPEETVVMEWGNAIRLRRGGFSPAPAQRFVWTQPVGVLIAGTSAQQVLGRVWYPRSRSPTSHGVEVLGMSGTTLTSQLADTLFSAQVIHVAP